jgi:hypothetical protein
VLTGTVVYDLTDVSPERMRNRVASLPEVPSGARVVVLVGALAPEPAVVRELARHQPRLMVDVHGTAHGVRRWLTAIRDPGEVLV